MYGKLFSSLYHGTLRGRAHQILVFSNLIAHSDKDGFVDKHWRAIAEECGITVDEVKAACIELESPDTESRSPEADGARLIRIDEHRSWGWMITNYAKYRAIRCEEDRRIQNRDAKRRERQKSSRSAAVSHGQPPSAHAEGDADGKVNNTSSVPAKAKAERQRNPLFDTLANVCGINTDELNKSSGSMIAKALSLIKESDPSVMPLMICEKAAIYRHRWPKVSLTPTALAKHWASLSQSTITEDDDIAP